MKHRRAVRTPACLCCRDWNFTLPGANSQVEARPVGHEQRAAQRLHMDTRGHRPNCQEVHRLGSRNKEEARLMAQLSKETLLLSWVQRFTRILGRVTDRYQIFSDGKFAMKKYIPVYETAKETLMYRTVFW